MRLASNRTKAPPRFSVVTVAVLLTIGLLPAPAHALDLASLLQSLLTPGSGSVAASPGVVPGPETAAIPPLPEGSGGGRRIVYSVGGQRVWLVDDADAVVGGWPVSGHVGFPSPGTYRVFSKSRVSSAGPLKLEYMTRFMRASSGKAVGFHAIPTRRGVPIQTEAQLGSFTSAGCVRQRLEDAAVLWDFAPIGTPVVVTR